MTVRLVTGPIHYDFLLPADADTRAAFGFAAEAGVPIHAPEAKWIVVGWGSRAFYTQTGDYTDLSLRTIWHAATGDRSVLRISVAGDSAGDMGTPGRILHLTQPEYVRLRAAILDTAPNRTWIPGAGLTRWDAFFEAQGRFHLFRTCNVWVAQVLRQAGIRFGRWTPTPYAVTLSLALFQGE